MIQFGPRPCDMCRLFLMVFYLVTLVRASMDIVVDSPFGKIRGARKTDENTGLSYLSFKGIPYAKPPVGDLRFAKPRTHPKLEAVFDATKEDLIACPYPDVLPVRPMEFTEDCLILNIQMKEAAAFSESDSQRKVIVYIHGGGFQFGASMIHDSASFVLTQDVIVVTVNYRLGVLGFISMENDDSPGNYGLWDQNLAIKWVKDNIRAFGGDPDDITIAGDSAGGAAVGYQIISPHSEGLFTKAYQMSGTATSVFARSTNARSDALEFAQSVGCWKEDTLPLDLDLQKTAGVMKCLRNVPLSEVTFYATTEVSKTKFVPCVDGDFVPDIPAKLLKDDAYLDSVGFFERSYLLSVVNNEISLTDSFMKMTKTVLSMDKSLSVEERESAFDRLQSDCKDLQMSRLGDVKTRDYNVVSEVISYYEKTFPKGDIVSELMVDLNLFISSLDFLIAASRRESTSSYFLHFNYFPRFVTGPRKGTPHEADLAFWFDFDLNIVEKLVNAGIRPEMWDDDDTKIKRMFSNIVGEFARSGNPGLALKDALPNGWPKYDVTTSHYLNFNLKPWVGSFLHKDRQDFWLNTVPSLIKSAEKSSTDIVVDCPFGNIRGVKKTHEDMGVPYLSFKNIPYAKPPVGDLRFAKPQPHPKLDGVLDASKDDKIICPHPKLMKFNETGFQEDCLILNILTKDINPSNPLKKVLVFIHGGGFFVGSSSIYDGKSFVISQDVIVVTINYRLGVLGFLSTENEASPGNYGLWDQALAIKWVKDNIQAFGGDPDDIAIAGESAGGASVGYQMISPHTKGLFTKAYPQSGTATSVFGRSLSARSDTLNMAKLAGCWDGEIDSQINLKESKTVIDCLRKAPVSIFAEFSDFSISKTSFVPVVDGDFIPDIPAKLLKDDDYLDSIGFFDRSYLVGVNNNEGTILDFYMTATKYMMFADNRTSEEQKELALKQFSTDIKALFMKSRLGEAGASDENLVSKIDDFYNKRFYGETALLEFVTDLTFVIPTLDYVVTTSRRSSCSSYLLYFDYFPHFMKGKYRGMAHGVDVAFWFDGELEFMEMLLQAGIQGHYTKEDVQLKQSFSSVVGDFIKTGNPGLSLKKSLPYEWPKYDATNGHYLRFNSNPWIDSFLMREKQDLWFGTVPSTMMHSPHIVHSEL